MLTGEAHAREHATQPLEAIVLLWWEGLWVWLFCQDRLLGRFMMWRTQHKSWATHHSSPRSNFARGRIDRLTTTARKMFLAKTAGCRQGVSSAMYREQQKACDRMLFCMQAHTKKTNPCRRRYLSDVEGGLLVTSISITGARKNNRRFVYGTYVGSTGCGSRYVK